MRWTPTLGWALFVGCLTIMAVVMMSQPSEFLYFQF